MSKEPNVKSLSVNDAQGNPVRLTISTDIVDYMAAARVFGREDLSPAGAHGRFQKRLIAIPDRESAVVSPMVLSIGSNNGLCLVRKREGSAGEHWNLTDLSPTFQKFGVAGAQVRALGAAWTDDDRIAVAVAVDAGQPNTPSRVFVAYDLSSRSDWENLAWVDCGTRENIRVFGIRVLAETDGGWTVVLDGDAGRVDMLYLIRSKRAASFAQALVFNPAVDYQEILDFEVAIDDVSGSGIAVLGSSGNKRVLSFRPFPEYDGEGRPSVPPVIPLPCPEGASVIESGVPRNGGTDLYIGGQGIYLLAADQFDDQMNAKLVPVAGADAASNLEEIVVADSGDGAVSIWARKQNGDLVIANRAAGAAKDQWGKPLRLRDGVQAIAPVQGGRLVTTSLLVVYTNGQAAFVLRDAASGTWRESPVVVGSPEAAAKIACYGTAVRVLDEGGFPRVDLPVRVSASVLTHISLNQNSVFIGPGLEVAAKTDANGAVRIYDRVRSLTPAVYRLSFDGIPVSIDVNPAGGIYERFANITAAELRQATVARASGGEEPLLPPEFRDGGSRAGEVDGMVGALTQAANLAAQTTDVTTAGATRAQVGSPFSSLLRLDAAPAGYQWGIQVSANGIRPADGSFIATLANMEDSLTQVLSDFGDTLADLFEGLKARVQEGWAFIVRKAEQAFEFICALGNKIKRFVLKTLEQIGGFFTWLWNEIKTGVEKVWEFLKFLVNWDDILVARDVLVTVANEAISSMKSSVGALKEKSSAGFDFLIDQLNNWRTDLGLDVAKTSFAAQTREAGPEAQQKTDQATGNSAIGWVFDNLGSLFNQIVKIEGANPSQVLKDGAFNFVKELGSDQMNNLFETWEQLQKDASKIFNGQMPSFKDLTFETIRDMLVSIGSNAAIGLLRSLRDIVTRALDLLGETLEFLRSILFARIRFPFIEKLVQLVSPETRVDASVGVVDALMLMVAVPATITYKLIFGAAPFKRGEIPNLPFGRVAWRAGLTRSRSS
jgi:hypothetical protein